ncbi:MAG: CHASE2 domain-containing protein, partial [Pseudomonadota bacterium]
MRRLTTPLVYLVLLGLVVGLRVADPPLVRMLRLDVFDAYQRWAPRDYAEVGVRIVDIDDATLARIGQWPWPRSVVADLLDRTAESGAAVVALGIVFAEPDRSSPARMLEQLRRVPGIGGLAPGRLLPDNDATLAERMQRLGAVASFALIDRPTASLPSVRWGVVTIGEEPLRFLPAFAGAVTNVEIIDSTVPAQGALNVLVDPDGVVRAVPLLARVGEEAYPGLVAEVLRHAQGASSFALRTTPAGRRLGIGDDTGIERVRIGALEVPTTAAGASLVHFTGHRPERFVPAWQVLEGVADERLLRDHIVLIGTSATGLGDVVATPLGAAVAGIEVQAELLEQLLQGVSLQRPGWAAGAELTLLLLLGTLLLVLLQRVGALIGALVGGLAVAGAIGASLFAFLRHGLLLDPVMPSLSLLAIYLVATVVAYIRTEAERAQVRRAFGLYLSPALVERLAAHPERLQLGGETRELTILFSDIRGFTSRAERMTAAELTRFINRFLTPMTDAIQDHDGTIDKYMGDGIMAFWNAPLDVPEHARRALHATLEMRRRLDRLNETFRAEEGPDFQPVRIGLGLNTGDCSVGNLGSERRFSYSAIGDPVNLAARFEGQCKTYDVDLLMSARTHDAAPGMAALELDLIRVIGTTRAEPIYTLVGDEDLAGTLAFRTLATDHAALLEAYRAGQWEQALAALEASAL